MPKRATVIARRSVGGLAEAPESHKSVNTNASREKNVPAAKFCMPEIRRRRFSRPLSAGS